MASRFQRHRAPDERVGEILSDSNSEVSSMEDDDAEDDAASARRRRGQSRAASVEQKKKQRPAEPELLSGSDKEDDKDAEEDEDDDEESHDRRGSGAFATNPVAAKVHQRPTPIKRKNSKWYDSEDDDDEWDRVASDTDKVSAASERTRSRSHSVPTSRAEQEQPPAKVNAKAETVLSADANQPAVVSPGATATTTTTATTAATAATKQPLGANGKRSSFQRLVDKTFNLSPFASKRKGLDAVTSPVSSGPDTPRSRVTTERTKAMMDPVARMRSPLSDVSSMGDTPSPDQRRLARGALGSRKNTQRSLDPNGVLSDRTNGSDVVSPQGAFRHSPAAAAATVDATGDTSSSRHRNTLVQSPGADDIPSAMRRGSDLPATGDALSPGQRKMPGAFPGRADSGVLLEGWLRQKQRRGVVGMKKWNQRYFVLYAKTNEVRYYADVVQSAWGPIPLGEIGCISLRLIQRIGKPGTLKYKGCRLDITCRNTWGTHYADDYVSSEEENNTTSNTNNNKNANSTSTPKSSRVYSLMADTPQTAGAWFSMLDSLLVRSANSPRVDVPPSSEKPHPQQLKRLATSGATAEKAKMMTRRRASTLELDPETVVLCGPHDHVPRPVLYAINFIFNSSPGIETEKFYETDADAGRLKTALAFLNQFATDAIRKPSKDELEQALVDPVTAGAVVRQWLLQLEQPLVPFEMYDDFRALAMDAKAKPFELARNLKALVRALPPRHFAMLACVLFHLNDVHEYASKNDMDAAVLATLFSEFIVRPRTASNNHEDAESERQLLRVVVEEMVAHVDAIIDEKEADILDRV